MASLTKLRKRLLLWSRYADRIGNRFGDPCGDHVNGYDRAWVDVQYERWRREVRDLYSLDAHLDDWHIR